MIFADQTTKNALDHSYLIFDTETDTNVMHIYIFI